jgi:hypothetical protein
MDWRFVEGERWGQVHDALEGKGVESIQAKWDELFAPRAEEAAGEKAPGPAKPPRKPAVRKVKGKEGEGTGTVRKPRKKESVEASTVKPKRAARKKTP